MMMKPIFSSIWLRFQFKPFTDLQGHSNSASEHCWQYLVLHWSLRLLRSCQKVDLYYHHIRLWDVFMNLKVGFLFFQVEKTSTRLWIWRFWQRYTDKLDHDLSRTFKLVVSNCKTKDHYKLILSYLARQKWVSLGVQIQ